MPWTGAKPTSRKKRADAEKLEQEARAERIRFEQETQQLAVERQELLNAAQADADEQREKTF